MIHGRELANPAADHLAHGPAIGHRVGLELLTLLRADAGFDPNRPVHLGLECGHCVDSSSTWSVPSQDPPMAIWCNDRLPAEKDADPQGMVLWGKQPGFLMHWTGVRENEYWAHSSAWQPDEQT